MWQRRVTWKNLRRGDQHDQREEYLDELCVFHEVMKGSTSLGHLKAFDTMVWRGRAVFCPRLLAGISIHYATCVNKYGPGLLP